MFDLALTSVGKSFDVVINLKDDDQVRRDLKEFFMPVSAERRQGLQPFVGEASAVILAFFLFGGPLIAAVSRGLLARRYIPPKMAAPDRKAGSP